MLMYANAFSCSVNQNKTECILTMRQISPDIDDEGKSSQLKIETVAQFVVSAESAKALCTLLNSVLSEE